jgi:hypothetical protein
MSDATSQAREFEREADRRRTSFLTELWTFMRHNKKWWITPIVLILILVGVLVFVGGSGAGPFIYTLF